MNYDYKSEANIMVFCTFIQLEIRLTFLWKYSGYKWAYAGERVIYVNDHVVYSKWWGDDHNYHILRTVALYMCMICYSSCSIITWTVNDYWKHPMESKLDRCMYILTLGAEGIVFRFVCLFIFCLSVGIRILWDFFQKLYFIKRRYQNVI